MAQNKRITMKLKQPNPLFERWLTEWRDREKQRNSKKQHCYDKALQSLKRYPLPLETGRECIILQGFGQKLCQMLDNKLKQDDPTEKSAKALNYTPVNRSGAYAILITLYKDTLNVNSKGFLLKDDIIQWGQSLCDKSFVKSDPGKFYTAWSSMATLINKRLVVKAGNPVKFSLTEQGVTVAAKLYENCDDKGENILVSEVEQLVKQPSSSSLESRGENKGKKLPKHASSSSMASDAVEESFIFAPDSFDILLLVDTQETAGASKKAVEDVTILELNSLRIKYEVRHLKIGDYCWICRERATDKELVLPYVVERKRMDDFGASIKDGRFHEQKFRLKQSGIQNLIYLVESYGNNNKTGLPLTTLLQAATNTLIQDGFSVKFTEGLRGTMEYLACFTRIIVNLFKSKTVISCPKSDLVNTAIAEDLVPLMTFKEFNKSSSKNKSFKVRELFIKQLLQLKGISVDKALAITEAFPTPRLLIKEYELCTPKQGENFLSGIQFGKLKKNVGPVISKTVYQLYSSRTY